jgi:iron complex outermembrane receptor protein
MTKTARGWWLATSGLVLAAGPAVAQEAAPPAEAPSEEAIVVTGSLLRRINTETPSPVTVLTGEALARRGLTNAADAVRSLSADNSGSIPSAFTGGFGQGSAAVSLRGLSANSTLTVIDGLRTTNYPLADDGQRSFVDLNTIPQNTIERIEVLKDGASSTYGADAIGGVVNIITRKHFKGVEATGELGISQRGDGGQKRGNIIGGFGDFDRNGWNVYLSGEYERNGRIDVRDRGFPFNTADLSSLGGANGLANLLVSGQIGTVAVVRPATQTQPGNPLSGVAVPGGAFQLLNPAACAAVGKIYDDGEGSTACEENIDARYGTIQPRQERYGLSGRASIQVGDDSEAYVTGTWYESVVSSGSYSSSIRGRNPINALNVVLPARLSNGTLNPNNPYAADGLAAQIYYRFGDIAQRNRTKSQVLRGAAGIAGRFGDGWSYSFDATAARSRLDIDVIGAINIPGLIAAINDGTYNFVDPSKNGDAVRRSLSPDIRTKAKAELYLAQGFIAKELIELPGGPLQIGAGAAIRRETLNQPNQNANQQTLNLNAYTAAGKRTVSAAFFEINAPVLKSLEITASGRYDHYSTGFDNFSPKVGVKFTPIPQIAFRGTYSRGFRAPSFAESGEGAVIGYTTGRPPQSVIDEHGNNAYVQSYSIGFNNAANPDLKPEKSRSFTAGFVAQPTRWLSLTADYYNIRKTDVIQGGPLSGDAIAAYYAGTPLPDGYTVTLDIADPDYPNATRKVLIVNAPYANASSLLTSGLDLSAAVDLRLGEDLRFFSQIEATHIFKNNVRAGEGQPVQHYAGTQGPYQISSGAGTPTWRGNWSNTLQYGPATMTLTAYYTKGTKSVAEDQNGAGATSCDDALYLPEFCHSKDFIVFDMTGSLDVTKNLNMYFNVLNLFDRKPPLNPANYAALNYNPTFAQSGAVGRFFRVGAKVKF